MRSNPKVAQAFDRLGTQRVKKIQPTSHTTCSIVMHLLGFWFEVICPIGPRNCPRPQTCPPHPPWPSSYESTEVISTSTHCSKKKVPSKGSVVRHCTVVHISMPGTLYYLWISSPRNTSTIVGGQGGVVVSWFVPTPNWICLRITCCSWCWVLSFSTVFSLRAILAIALVVPSSSPTPTSPSSPCQTSTPHKDYDQCIQTIKKINTVGHENETHKWSKQVFGYLDRYWKVKQRVQSTCSIDTDFTYPITRVVFFPFLHPPTPRQP